MRYAGRLTPEEFWARYAETEQRMRDGAGRLPCYGLAEWSGPRTVGDHMWENDYLATMGLAHGDPDMITGQGPMVHVRTTTRDPLEKVQSLRLYAAAGWPDLGEADQLRLEEELEAAVGEPVTIPVADVPVRFSLWREDQRWWAAGHHGGYGLVLEARQFLSSWVRLVRVYDVEPYLAEARAQLRAWRGEA